MKRWSCVVLAGAMLLGGGVAWAQDDEQDYYLDEEIDEARGRYALGLGFGLVELGDNVLEGQTILEDDDVEQYFTINLRILFGDPYAHHGPGRSGGFRGYLEPEIGYWSAGSDVVFAGDSIRRSADTSDLLLGINVIGGMPVSAVEFFVGGGVGIHFIDSDNERLDGESLGFNAQFGADVSVSKKVSIFAVGRFDLVDDERDELEGKAYLGVRFRFGGDDEQGREDRDDD